MVIFFLYSIFLWITKKSYFISRHNIPLSLYIVIAIYHIIIGMDRLQSRGYYFFHIYNTLNGGIRPCSRLNYKNVFLFALSYHIFFSCVCMSILVPKDFPQIDSIRRYANWVL